MKVESLGNGSFGRNISVPGEGRFDERLGVWKSTLRLNSKVASNDGVIWELSDMSGIRN